LRPHCGLTGARPIFADPDHAAAARRRAAASSKNVLPGGMFASVLLSPRRDLCAYLQSKMLTLLIR
jgi:hypothetical protein